MFVCTTRVAVCHSYFVFRAQMRGGERSSRFFRPLTRCAGSTLTSDDVCDDPLEGGQSETKCATAGEPDTVKAVTTADSDPASVTSADPAGVGIAWTPKSCLRAANAFPKGHTVSFKDRLLKLHFYYYLDPDDIWSQCGSRCIPRVSLTHPSN
jgi:hypothetical protein